MVNRSRNYTLFFYLCAALVTCTLVLVNYLAMEYRARVDLTADHRYTLSEGTRKIFDKLLDPIQVTYYVNAELPPARVNLERDVVDKLSELAGAAGRDAAGNPKFSYTVERIERAQFASKLEELKKYDITPTTDVQSSGGDDSSVATDASQFFSSVLVRHGTGKEVAINGIMNLVAKEDDARPNRVDTLEFDIMFALMRMRSQVQKSGLKQMLKSLTQPLLVAGLVSEQMPRANPKLGKALFDALDQLEAMGIGNVKVGKQKIEWGKKIVNEFGMPSYFTPTTEPTVDPNEPPDPKPPSEPPKPGEPPRTPPPKVKREGPNFYYAYVRFMLGEERWIDIQDFSGETTAEACLKKIEDRLWDMLKPNTTLGLITPANSMDFDPRGGPPQSSYAPLANHIRVNLGYDTRVIDLRAREKIPADLALLIVFEPQSLSERELYEVDRYLNQGGNVALLYQGWSARFQVMRADVQDIPLQRNASSDAFTKWAEHMGLSFGENFLVHRSGYRLNTFQNSRRGAVQQPVEMPVAVNVGADDVDRTSVFSRGLSGWPLPFASEVKIDDKRVEALKLQRQDIIRLSGEVYNYAPEAERFASIYRGLGFDSPEVAKRINKLDHAPLMASLLTGLFPSYWEGKTIPKFEGAPDNDSDVGGQPAPAVKTRPGKLVVCGCAASLNSDYFPTWREKDIQPLLNTSVSFYRNLAEAFIYGDELVSLRAKTGAPPRIAGGVKSSDKVTWFLLCIGGVPLALAAVGFLRGIYRNKAREEYLMSLKEPGASHE
ncbi:MAG: Gldg family protein [Planctomycetes bacterium]|nr:Gldg family protein [Planctomycetota bacterium]